MILLQQEANKTLTKKGYTVIMRKSKFAYVAICLKLKFSDEEIVQVLQNK
jgi:hypothetical protein